MLLNEIIQHLSSSDIKDFVFEAELLGELENINANGISKVSVSDVRSATFYACGLAQKNDRPVALVVRSEYLSSTFTGLMESWFQRRCIIVIAVGRDILNHPLCCYKTCTSGQYKVQKLTEFESCFAELRRDLPALFLVEESIERKTLSYDADIEKLIENIPQKNKLFVYSPITSERSNNKNVLYIAPEYKYGMISKFLGHCISQEEKCILLTDLSVLKLEMNLFNSRYLDKRFNLIVTGEKPSDNILQWLQSNGIETAFCDSIDGAGDIALNSDKATAVFAVTQEVEEICTQTL